jgi:hypothetical protein
VVVTRREACALLREHGVGSDAAKRALAGGLAGRPMRVGGHLLFDRTAVQELAARRVVERVDVPGRSPRGLFLARRDVPVHATRDERLDAVARGWEAMSLWHLVSLRIDITVLGPLPLVATTGGFVTLGADVVDVVPLPSDGRHLVLAEPGPWYAGFEGRRVRGGPGRPWEVYRPRVSGSELLARGRIAG